MLECPDWASPGLWPNRGAGGLRGYIKNQTPSVIMYFLKWAWKTILGPLKHVLHLVWSAYVTSKGHYFSAADYLRLPNFPWQIGTFSGKIPKLHLICCCRFDWSNHLWREMAPSKDPYGVHRHPGFDLDPLTPESLCAKNSKRFFGTKSHKNLW